MSKIPEYAMLKEKIDLMKKVSLSKLKQSIVIENRDQKRKSNLLDPFAHIKEENNESKKS
jgi:hypothetical protein